MVGVEVTDWREGHPRGLPPPMIGKALAVGAFGADGVDLPRLAQLAPGAAGARTVSFMMPGISPFPPPAAGKAYRANKDAVANAHA